MSSFEHVNFAINEEYSKRNYHNSNYYVSLVIFQTYKNAILGNVHCRNPTLAKCGGEAQHFQSWGFGVLRDSRMFSVRQQGPKHLALKCSWCH
jgi:hypothetical protein